MLSCGGVSRCVMTTCVTMLLAEIISSDELPGAANECATPADSLNPIASNAVMNPLADCLRDHRFAKLFLANLGWDRLSGTRTLVVEGRSLTFRTMAHKRGLQVFWCQTDRAVLCNRGLLREFQKLLTRVSHQHIVLFSCEEPRKQVWQWVIRLSNGRKVRHREPPFCSAAPPPALLERLAQLRFTLKEKASMSPGDVRDRIRRALDTSAERNLFAGCPSYAARSKELTVAMRGGDVAAFQRFILLHLPLARKFSKWLQRRFGMADDEAEQISVHGLIEAARLFRSTHGYHFDTCAIFWMQQACRRYGPQVALLIRIPVAVFWKCYRHGLDVERLLFAGGPASVRDRLAELEIVNPWLAKRWRAYLRARNVGSLSDHNLLRQAQRIPDPAAPPVDGLLGRDASATIRAALQHLRPRDARVIRLRFGLEGAAHTLEQIGRQMNLTKERVRQLESMALHRLRTFLCQKEHPTSAVRPDAEPMSHPSPAVRLRERITPPAPRCPSPDPCGT